MRIIFSLAITLLSSLSLFGQGVFIDNETRFQDGVYASYEDFINNEPSLPFAAFDIKWIESPYFNKLVIKSCKSYQKGKLKKTNMQTVWGFCLGGIPYIQYGIDIPYKLRFGNSAIDLNGKASFSRIRILGNICHFNIEDHLPKSKTTNATKLFAKERSGKMIRAQRMLKLSTGKVYQYDEYILSELIKDDEQLVAQYKQDDNREYKMFMYLQKYNERNPILNRSVLATKE